MKRYLLSIFILAAGIVFLVLIAGQSLLPLLDLPSFIITVVTPLLFVTILFGFKETHRAFAIIRKGDNEHDSLMNALAFFKVYGKATWFLAIIAAIAGGIGVLVHFEDPASIGPNLALALEVLFYCGVVQLAIVIPYTVIIHKQLGNTRIRSDIFSKFGSLFGVCFASLLLFAIFVPDFLELSAQELNQVTPFELLKGIRDKADVEGSGILEYELYDAPNESSDFQAFVRSYTQMLEEYVFDQSSKYWIEDNTGLSENVKILMDYHKRNLSTTHYLIPDGSTIFIFNCLNSNGKYEYFFVNAYKKYVSSTQKTTGNSVGSGFAEAYIRRGRAYYWKEDFDQAIADFTEAIRLDPESMEAYNMRGMAYFIIEDYDRAIADYTRVIQITPYYAWAFKYRGNAYSEKGDYDRAIADYNQAISLNLDSADAYYYRGYAYYFKGDYDRAITDFTQVIRFDPDSADAYYYRGNSYLNKRDYDQAIADYTQMIRLAPEYTWAYKYRGDAYYDKGDYDLAIADFTQAILIDPDNTPAYSRRGGAYYDKGDYDLAIADYTYLIQIFGQTSGWLYNHRGDAYGKKGDYDRAIADYTQALQIDTISPYVQGTDPEDAWAYKYRGNAYSKKGDIDSAIADYTQAIQIDPKDADTYYNRGNAYKDKKDYDRAIADYKAALRIDSKHDLAEQGLLDAREAQRAAKK